MTQRENWSQRVEGRYSKGYDWSLKFKFVYVLPVCLTRGHRYELPERRAWRGYAGSWHRMAGSDPSAAVIDAIGAVRLFKLIGKQIVVSVVSVTEVVVKQ